MTTETLTTRKGLAVERKMTDAEAVVCLEEMLAKHHKFAGELLAKYRKYGSLTQDQLAWAHKLACEHRFGREQKFTGNFPAILAMFATATGSQLKRPRITFTFDDQAIEFKLAGARSSYAGCVYVTDGVVNGKWFGRIHPADGRFEASHHCREDVAAFLDAFNAQPAEIAALCGKKAGQCGFCRLKLTDERSVEVGYGPKCAKQWGLPWGKKDK